MSLRNKLVILKLVLISDFKLSKIYATNMFHLTSSSRAERVAQQHFDMQRAVLKIGETITARQERYNNFKKTLTAETLKNVCVRKQVFELNLDSKT